MNKSPATLRIPVRLVDGIWEHDLGGKVPVKNDTKAELVVPRASISDKAFLKTMERKEKHKVLDEGTSLLVCMTIKSDVNIDDKHKPLLEYYSKLQKSIAYLDHWSSGIIVFVRVRLDRPNDKQARLLGTSQGGLWLMTEGIRAVGLASTTVKLPDAISEEPVASLNHAYTKLSETFETWRISHTGNIYKRVLYQEKNETWYPLEVLRDNALAKQEQKIARDFWDDFMARMTSQQTLKK